MVNKKLLAAVVIVIIVAAGAVAAWQLLLTEPEPSTEGPTTIKIGLVAPYSIPVGQDMDRAARMAVDEINAAGGVYVSSLDKYLDIELVTGNTEGANPEAAVTEVTRLISQEDVDLLIGGFGSSATLAGQVPAIESRVPYIITGASSHLVTRRGFLPDDNSLKIDDAEGMSYMFHYCTTTYHYSETVAYFFAEAMQPLLETQYDLNRNLRLAVLYRDDAFGQGVWDATKHFIEEDNLPIDIVAEVNYPTTTTTFQAELTTVKAAEPDAVYVVDFTTNTAIIYIQGQNDVGLNSVYIAVECCEEPEFYTALGQWGDYQLLESKFASYAGPPFYLPMMDTYVADYEELYNTIPGMMGADTYDAFYIAKDAIERAGTIDKADVRDAIESCSLDQMLIITESGKIEFSTEEDSYHEIAPFTFVEQLIWDETAGECRPVLIWPETAPIVGQIQQADFVLPETYEPGSP
ncbi:MAG: ABC transporter substrate-binding protein [Candidatus Bathyarchaeota archaeon]|nr:ABC transporter substrate-binding protein [Candidatus Bathyarchaeota archaeon]